MRPVIIALDFPSQATALDFLTPFAQTPNLFVKVGMELFYTAGPQILTALRARGIQVFLDLKCYDIPHTVEQTMVQLGRQGVALVTIHAAGGAAMVAAAKRGLVAGAQAAGVAPAKLLAVTQLTSTTEAQMQAEQLISADLPTTVRHLAHLAWQNGADGVIAAAPEDPVIHAATAPDFLCINPGIRLTEDATDDQQRVVTPGRAAALGSNGLVVGRSITRAADPLAAYQRILKEWGD
ncbi:orotidine 5'-phosphate decarboxylase [Levilactobacillus zymae]|uniref:Orotidine 5'-phosphate decarboxylase n=1 Tax=Levilactobacillus zymae TaxID=267363 RepID=A0ABQ0WWI9_9LACO|nr:orotidine-5'-phosphate decarboxylase [Levilactobacillus zymae]KRL06873.1 orotidine-5-phosphate decarboxylase [Levilactobacillus zymae DSM 19395]QFR61735.1 orotidine-5'-phosphate decarboxylase [Levilactobacillus zymae]GEO72244.1 orotidine 5'-phosphate decarboxylase [Levilactobacillus zymae]